MFRHMLIMCQLCDFKHVIDFPVPHFVHSQNGINMSCLYSFIMSQRIRDDQIDHRDIFTDGGWGYWNGS